VNSKVVLYADKLTDSIKSAVAETNRRRKMQIDYNRAHGITPMTIVKPVKERVVDLKDTKHIPKKDIPNMIIELDAQMREAAEVLDFERAIALRDRVGRLKQRIEEK
jgi:excinuclease ABC subunit B